MIYSRLYMQVILRVCLLLLTCLVLAYVFVVYKEPIALANIGALLIMQVILLVRYLNRTNRALANFFQAVKIEDTSFMRPMKLEKSYSKLWDELDKVSKTLGQVRIRLQRQNNYFQTVTEHIGTGLISYGEDGRVNVFNKAARELLGIKNLTNINGIRELDKGLFDTIEKIEAGERRIEKLIVDGKKLQISVGATVLKEGDKHSRLITLQDIRNEMEANELDSWQKLIRVLNHEIMNSIAPITSTISTLSDYYSEDRPSSEAIAKTKTGLEIIRERSEGLKQFVNRYRELTSLPKPEFEDFDIKEMLDGTVRLLEEEMLVLSIEIRTKIDPVDMKLNADMHLVEQVLINLIKNAVAAEAKNIEISAFQNDKSQPVIQVKDDGTGIPEEIVEEIFVPFFTTREEGMGVGLSLSRQIMRMHGGSLLASSVPGSETVFTLVF